MEKSAEVLKGKLLNAVEHALIEDEITIEQYGAIVKRLQKMESQNYVTISCDNEIYLLSFDNGV